TAILNVTLNLFFVLVLDLGIAGVAWSTVVAEAVSAVLVVIILTRAEGSYRLTLRKLRVYASVSGEIVRLGLPGGIQQSVISASNIVVQSYINGLGGAVMAGYSASTKLDQFITLPAQTMAMSVTTFVGQNLGAGKVDRARRGTRQSIIMGLCVSVCLSAIVMAARTSLLRIFTPDPEVLEHGFAFIRVFAPMYFLLCFTQIIPGALRGAGNVRMATATTIFSFVILRQIYLFVITRINYTITTVALAYPVTWAIAAVILTVYYSRSDWNRFSLQYGGKPLDSKD
ncbi:MAG: MATE family efflux transporter, partial [Clostridia bacterium]|nr:MATE family efflux transporter [Clostridia bacterium]